MAKKIKLSKNTLTQFYADYVLLNGKEPVSVYAFMKTHELEEEEFYTYYSSFKHLRKDIFKIFLDHTVEVLGKSKEYETYDAKTKLLSFYYTFFEILTKNRSYVTYALQNSMKSLEKLSELSALRKAFISYFSSLDLEVFKFIENSSINSIKDKTTSEMAWGQMLVTLKFYLSDNSPKFEKTDVFIEKSINAAFDMVDLSPLKNVIDLGKFMFKERMNFVK